jgi:hypothetical protein
MATDKNSLSITLSPNILDSPGSSVFDLPTHSRNLGESSVTQPRLSQPPDEPSGHSEAGQGTDASRSSSVSFVVISGGTGGNAICSAFGPNTYHVLPVSDDGGSSSEIIRVLGGPSIGM